MLGAPFSGHHPQCSRRASFVYHAEGYDIPGGWEPLMARHYDVMYSESYDTCSAIATRRRAVTS